MVGGHLGNLRFVFAWIFSEIFLGGIDCLFLRLMPNLELSWYLNDIVGFRHYPPLCDPIILPWLDEVKGLNGSTTLVTRWAEDDF